ncbi:MAG: valine--tRNA ligase [Planctomycetota bacterium]|jgi:valyl-tRNA synthetase
MADSNDKTYNPQAVQDEVAELWNKANAFHAEPDPSVQPYVIVIPPPNVTAPLHMGHALNNTLQDIQTRYHRMLGHNTAWIPGTDHAGIATQTVVDKRLQMEGRPALKEYKKMEAEGRGGREQFIEKVQAWKDEYEARITHQLVEMGCSCDWDRQRFTMDPVCARAVREAFYKLFEDGLIYRGKRLVNWDPATQTALADDEVEMQDIAGHFWYMRYPVVDDSGAETGEYATVATTRPETMLGDTGVAVNPKDEKNAPFIGKKVRLPIVGRVIPIIGDEYVVIPDPESSDAKAKYASGFLKVTPAHDPNDWEIGQRHELDIVNVMAPDGSISDKHGWDDGVGEAGFLMGMSREEARAAIVDWFDQNGLLAEVRDYEHAVGHSYRSHVPVEPYLSDQWYVKVTDDRLAGAALRAMTPDQRGRSEGCSWKKGDPFDGVSACEPELTFYPERYAKTFQTWHENIRDWCISRQLWWGHRIPVWRRDRAAQEATPELLALVEKVFAWQKEGRVAVQYRGEHTPLEGVEKTDLDLTAFFVCVRDPEGADADIVAELEAGTLVQDPDVLDTWFSSGLWPLSTLGWPEETPELTHWNPTSTLGTAREIITLWVSRMVMFNLYFRDCLPFKDVFIHTVIQDGEGQKMSKSLGNGVDPLDIIHSHGADAMRFTLASMSTQTQDVGMPVDMVCPHTGETFEPKKITTPAGHVVAAPEQGCPSDPSKKMVTSYGVASGLARESDETPLARNTSTKFDYGRNFANKMWNAGRFAMQSLEGRDSTPGHDASMGLADKWVLARLAIAAEGVGKALDEYRFNEYAQSLYDFFRRELCDWYLESVKGVIEQDTPEGAAARQTLAVSLDAVLRMMHPVAPFITEKLWGLLNELAPERGANGVKTPASVMLVNAAWPQVDKAALHDETIIADYEKMQETVTALRTMRSEYNVAPRVPLAMAIKADGADAACLEDARSLIQSLGFVEITAIGPDVEASAESATSVLGAVEMYVEGLVDPEAERERLTKRLDELTKSAKALEGRLSNKGYVDRAPAHLVQETRDQLTQTQEEIAMVEGKLNR